MTTTTHTAPPVITTVEADAYFLGTPRNNEWVAIGAADQPIWLAESQRWLETLCVDPDTEGCCGDFTQRWTMAVSELALALFQNPNAIITGGVASGVTGETKSQKIGDLEVSYYQSVSGTGSATNPYGAKANPVLRAFPWVGTTLSCWIQEPGMSRLIQIERN